MTKTVSDSDIIRYLDEITIDEWTRWEWEDVTKAGDELRLYARGVQRTPSDASRAYQEFRDFQRVTPRDYGKKAI